MSSKKELKAEIFRKVKEYYLLSHKNNFDEFMPGDKINYAGRVFDEEELINLIDSSLEFWLTYGKYSKKFELKLAEFLGVSYCLLVNSGSSANLLAFMALTSPLLNERQIKRGDEVITVAACFPTTVSPILQYGAVPVFVDIDIETANIDCKLLDNALSPKTKAVVLAHTLGNPFNVEFIKGFCKKHSLWLIEDNCDSLGSKYDGKYTGTFGDIGTSSFYPPHHMTMGEGGAVYTSNGVLHKIMLSMRDWGRDCWCDSGKDNTCGKRFSGQYGLLPYGYDHKYVYSHLGFNLKATDLQAAIGCAQLKKLPQFIKKRKENFNFLYKSLKNISKITLFSKLEKSEPSWFGFMITLNKKINFNRNEIVLFLEKNNIQTRNLFSGNITRHPCFLSLKRNYDYRISGDLLNTDWIMNNSFWIGVYPGMGKKQLNYIVKKIIEFIDNKTLSQNGG